MVEINPLVLTNDGKVLAADSKITVDSNALYRQKDLADQEDKTQENDRERHAKDFDLNYIVFLQARIESVNRSFYLYLAFNSQ